MRSPASPFLAGRSRRPVNPSRQREEFVRVRKFAAEIAGPEDLEVDLFSVAAPRLLVSAFDRHRDSPGGLYSVGLAGSAPDRPLLLADQAGGFPLRPHGISLTRSTDGQGRLYVINHRRPEGSSGPRHTVEVFRLSDHGPGLHHERTLADPLLTSPNDLFGMPDGQIYLTNDLNNAGLLGQMLEFTHLRTFSTVVHFTGTRWRIALRGPRFANGIAVRHDRLCVISSLDQTLDIHRRDSATGDIGERLERLRLAAIPDNLLWGFGPEGRPDHTTLYAAGHADLLKFLRAKLFNAQASSPSVVYRIRLTAPAIRIERIFADDGRRLSGSSVGVVLGEELYVGQVLDRGLFRISRE